MTTLTPRDVQHVFEQLRGGKVPERGIDAFAVGIDKAKAEIGRQLDLAADGEGVIKFLRGGYGCGKTFMARLALLEAQRRNFATSFVVVSDSDLKFHKFDDVYRKTMTDLSTAMCPRGALNDILDRWIGQIEDALVDVGADEEAPDFDDKVRRRLDEDLASLTGGQAPQDFVRVIQTIFDLKQRNDAVAAGSLVSWLSGSKQVAASAKKEAAVKGDVSTENAMDYLRGVLEIVKAAGHKGLVIVIDEAETILRMRKDSRHRSLNGIRQIADASGSYPGLMWLFTGTPEFFDTRRGVAGLEPLDDRIKFISRDGFASRRQPQLELTPFDAGRLRSVALRLRELFPAADRARLEEKVSDRFIDKLVDEVTKGFRGDVGVVPRQFLREFVTQMDLVEEHDDYDPMTVYRFKTSDDLRPEEQHAATGEHPAVGHDDDDDDLIAVEDVW
jgi:hypothetical protein